jgi:gliding motility-associated-like protein
MKNCAKLAAVLLPFVFLVLNSESLAAQSLISGNYDQKQQTAYPVFTPNDPVYFFWGQEGTATASLTAQSAGASVSFLWEKYDPVTAKFLNFTNFTGTSSLINNLADGCYRVTFTENGKQSQFRAWVFNAWIRPDAKIAESTCIYLKLSSSAVSAVYQYYDLANGQAVKFSQVLNYRWYIGTQQLYSVQNPTVFQPPSTNVVYRVEITDVSGCMRSATVNYTSVIPTAKFSWTTPQKNDPQYAYPEAPADIDFKNESVNADADKYEWFLFKDKKVLSEEGGGTTAVDSFLTVLYDVNPLYTYDRTGRYRVKLVAAKTTQTLTCRDTFYLPDYIVVDTSLVKVAPVFTPNGDGVNDKLIIKARSLESLEFTVLNRWGKVVHHFSTNNFIPSDTEIATWDGRVNGKLCTPGTYFYVAEAKGRDGEKRRSKGFIQVIW